MSGGKTVSNYSDTPGKVRYFIVGRVPVKLTYGEAEPYLQGRGFVTVDAHNLLCPDRRHSLYYVEECDDHDELTEAEYLEAVAKMDATDLSFERGQLAGILALVQKENT